MSPALFARRLVVALCMTLPAACTADTATAPSTTPASQPSTAAATQVTGAPFPVDFATTEMTLKNKKFAMEIAGKEAQRERGLMYRDTMPADHGMLFIMDTFEKTAFWMENTRIPLDLVFLDQSGKVVDILHGKPFDRTPIGPNAPVRYVIELNDGMSEKIGLKKGDLIKIPAVYVKN